MKTLYESLFDIENNINNIEDDVNKTQVINWFVEHDLDEHGYEFWESIIKFNANDTIDILMNNDAKVRRILLNFDKCYPDYIKVNNFCGRILMDITKANKIDFGWFAKHISAPSSIKLVCEDTDKLIIPNTIKFERNDDTPCVLNVYSDKLSYIDFKTQYCPQELTFRCKNLNDVNFKHTPKYANVYIKHELCDKINNLNNDSGVDILVQELSQKELEFKPKYN